MPRPKKICEEIGCDRPRDRHLRCSAHGRAWERKHEDERCQWQGCRAMTANPTGGLRLGRELSLRDGSTLFVCRAHVHAFIEEHREEAEEILARSIMVDEKGAWMATKAYVNASGYSQVKMPGVTEGKIYAHHLAYALFQGNWQKDEQIHHRTQVRTEISPWTLLAVKTSEHEALKADDPRPEAIRVAKLEQLEEFAERHSLPLPWKQPAPEEQALVSPYGATRPPTDEEVQLAMEIYSRQATLEEQPAPEPKSVNPIRAQLAAEATARLAAAAAQPVIEEQPAPQPEPEPAPVSEPAPEPEIQWGLRPARSRRRAPQGKRYRTRLSA